MPKHAKKEEPFEVELTPFQAMRFAKRRPASEPEKFVPPDPRCNDCYYWRHIAESSPWKKCCHHILEEGKMRKQISKTECGSFLDKKKRPERKRTFQEVPVSQWGCPEVVDWKTQR